MSILGRGDKYIVSRELMESLKAETGRCPCSSSRLEWRATCVLIWDVEMVTVQVIPSREVRGNRFYNKKVKNTAVDDKTQCMRVITCT